MAEIRDALFIWLLKFPFFLVIYSFIFLLSQDGSASLFFVLLAVYTLVCALDALIKLKALFAVSCALICTALFLLEQQSLAIMAIGAAVNRSTAYTPMVNFLWIACLGVSTLIVEFIDPALSRICIRNVLAASVATLLTRQMQTLDRFFNSHYCWGISRKTAVATIRRVYKLTVLSLGLIALAGFLAASTGSPEAGMRETVPGLVGDFVDFAGPVLQDLGMRAPPPEAPEGALPPLDMGEMVSTVQSISHIVMYAVMGVMLAVLVSFLIYSVQKRAAFQFEDYDEVVEEGDALVSGSSGHGSKMRLKLGPSRTIRRLFRLKVREHMNESGLYPHRSDTPEELSKTIAQWEDVEPLKELYHKARYSGAGVSRDELNDYYAWRRDHS